MTEYATIVTTALGTGLATAIFNQGIGWWRDHRKDASSSRYLAIRIAITLESYAIECADQIADADIERRWAKLPELPAFPDEESWSSLQPDLLEQALAFRHEITLARSFIQFSYNLDGPGDNSEAKQQCGKCGFMAWQTAEAFRRKYNFSIFDPLRTSWDLVGALKPLHDAVLAEAAQRNAK